MYEKPELTQVGEVAQIVLGGGPPTGDSPQDRQSFDGIVLGLDE